MSNIVIAVDGPAASGKSTVSKRAAALLNFVYVDSGALYRGITWLALEDGISCEDAEAVVGLLNSVEVSFAVESNAVVYTMNGRTPGDAIRTPEVNDNVSYVAVVPEVRARVVAWLRDMAGVGSLVMEGRDIASKVFPNADFKFYLDASPEVRTCRRTVDFDGKVDSKDVAKNLQKRDAIDSGRKVDPLTIAEGAEVVDTSDMTIDDVAEFIAARVSD